MNTITQIENALKAINQASFQNLINHLLHLQGNKFIGAPGAVVGKEKTSKGSPDSFFINEEKYAFVECTTKEKLGQSKGFFEKLSKDIDHCFDEAVTGVSKERIEKVVLACTEKISPTEFDDLRKKVQSYNLATEFDILNIQNLPLKIYDFPKLADEYLGVEIVKGAIYTLEDFLLKTKKGLQPSLVNEFIGREEELKNCIEILKQTDWLLLSGGQGIGKSKLAVKILEELSKEEYVPLVIQSSAVPLWDDLKHLFQHGKNYIVLFDDANKSIQNLNYLLSVVEKPKSFSVKVIVTSRDYVKKQVVNSLDSYAYQEVVLSEFKDEEIGKIILTALPNLKYHVDVKRKIVDLAKGNARVALMATYSLTSDTETNYLNSPVLLYEKYFRRIAEEIGIFDKPIILQSLAIVSFFGVLDRNNEEIKGILDSQFNIDWNELWSAIMDLHSNEILNVHANEVVKVSDQVLATFAFYKCFIDEKSAVINYAEWIRTFTRRYSPRIRTTLIDINNTFDYDHVKELVNPHLNEVLKSTTSDEDIYAFYSLFWFYKGKECLAYLKKWVESQSQEPLPETLTFTYVHNDHTQASEHFELLNNFWQHQNELLKPSIEITLELLAKQPSRLPEVLKFIHDGFSYTWTDTNTNFFRQNILLDVLLDTNIAEHKKIFTAGIFLSIGATLLGWRFTEFGGSKGRSFTIYNFELYKSEGLMKLRNRILTYFYTLKNIDERQTEKILNQIIYPGGDIDKSIYVDEMPIYEKIISENLSTNQYFHCQFVKTLANYITREGAQYPASWNSFIESEIMELSEFLKPGWQYRDDKSIEEFEKEKREEFNKYVTTNSWDDIEKFLLNTNSLFVQQSDGTGWHIETAITDIYLSIAKKNRNEFEKALRLFFSCKVSFPLRTTVINYALQNNILTGGDFLEIMNDYDFENKEYWTSTLLVNLPEDQINTSFLALLIRTFETTDTGIYVHTMLDYLKYDGIFQEYKKEHTELENHNIITYITSLIMANAVKHRRSLGYDFCTECGSYFTNHLELLKAGYVSQKEIDKHFDYDGKQLEAVLKLDSNFFIEHLEQKAIDSHYLTFKLEEFKLDYLWTLPNYEELIIKALEVIIVKRPTYSNWDHPSAILFTFHQPSEENPKKALSLLDKYMCENISDEQRVLVVLNIVMHKFSTHFISFLKTFLLRNKDIERFKDIHLDRNTSYSGSRVPYIQKEIDFTSELIVMVKGLPDILDYSEHIDYLEQRILWLKKDIKREQRRDFEDEYF